MVFLWFTMVYSIIYWVFLQPFPQLHPAACACAASMAAGKRFATAVPDLGRAQEENMGKMREIEENMEKHMGKP